MKKESKSINDEAIKNPILKSISIDYFNKRFIIDNIPRSPVIQLDTPCHKWTAGKSGNYGVAFINNKNLEYNYRCLAHRLSYMLFNGPTHDKLVLHLCQEELCVNPLHLTLGDQVLNAEHHQINKTRTHPHPKHINDLLTKDVRQIRVLHFKHGYPIKLLAEMYKKSYKCISDIVNFKTWKI